MQAIKVGFPSCEHGPDASDVWNQLSGRVSLSMQQGSRLFEVEAKYPSRKQFDQTSSAFFAPAPDGAKRQSPGIFRGFVRTSVLCGSIVIAAAIVSASRAGASAAVLAGLGLIDRQGSAA